MPPGPQRTSLPELTPAELRRASRRFKKNTAVGFDGIPMHLFAKLSDDCLQALALMYEAMENWVYPAAVGALQGAADS